jgi:hypothetical protein
MGFLYYFILYFFIGACLNIFYEIITYYLDKQGKLKDHLTDYDKFISIIIWPLGLLIFLLSFFRAYFNEDKD